MAREREMLHRAQEALRSSQQNNSDLERSKIEAEQKLKASADELATTSRTAKSAQTALRTQLQAATASQTDLTRKLEEATRQLTALTIKQRDTATQLSARESELIQVRQDLRQSDALKTSCEAKNVQLYEYSQALLQQYQKKGVWSALAQKDPVLGIKEVGIENVVQEYQEKLAAQKLAPVSNPAVSGRLPPSPAPQADPGNTAPSH